MSTFDEEDASEQRLECPKTYLCMLVIAGAFFLICALFLTTDDENLSAHLTMASVSNFSISNPSGPTSTITGTWLLTFAIDNDDEDGISMYPGLQSRVFYQEYELGQGRTTPFSLGNWSSTDITVRLATSEFYIYPLVAEQMNDDWMSLGTVKFDFTVSVIGYEIDALIGPFIQCDDIPLKFNQNSTGNGSSGEYIGSPWECVVLY